MSGKCPEENYADMMNSINFIECMALNRISFLISVQSYGNWVKYCRTECLEM